MFSPEVIVQKKRQLIEVALFFICGFIYCILYILIFTKLFDKRPPVRPVEFIPLIPLVLLWFYFSIFLIFKDGE